MTVGGRRGSPMREAVVREHGWEMFSSGHGFLESPRWHDGALWLSDFISREVIRISPDGGHEAVMKVAGTPSGLGFLADGSILVVSSEDRRVLRRRPDGDLESYADFDHIAEGRGNDMIVASGGHCYVGNFGSKPSNDTGWSARLAHIDPERRVSEVEGELTFPNGMVTYGDTLIVAETFAHRLTAFEIAADGGLTSPRVWARLDEDQHPDGIAIDADGGVWYANTKTSQDTSGFYRVEEGGRITDRIATDGVWAVACAFGGADLSELFITCARTSNEDFYAGRSDAFIARADVGRRGAPASQ